MFRGFIRFGQVLILAAAVAAQAPVAAKAEEKVIRAVMGDDLGSLDPVFTTADLTLLYSFMVYDTLFGLDEDGNVQPQMVDSYSVTPDQLTFTFTLRDGLMFHDDTPVTAKDVTASWKRWAQTDARGQMIANYLDRFEVVDDKTWKVVLKSPFGQLIPALASPFAMPLFIMPERLANQPADKEITESVGSGPFKFVPAERVPGSKAVWVKNEKYVPRSEKPSGSAGAKLANVDRIEWVTIKDAQTAANALINGEVDFILEPSADMKSTLEASPDVRLFVRDEVGAQGIMRLNHLNPPFDNPKIRQAIQNFVPQKDIITAVTGSPDQGVVCGAILVCGSPWASEFGADDLISSEPQDVRNARGMQELKDAGYKGEPITVLYPQESPIQGTAALIIAETMKKAGVNVDLQTMDWATTRQRRTVKDSGPNGWHLFLTVGGGLSSSDMAFHIPASAACDQAWFGWPCDEEIERIRKAWVTETDPAKQRDLAVEYQKRAMEVTVYLPYGQFRTLSAVRKEIGNIANVPETRVFWNMTKGE